jgi:hypothetical protein
MSIMDFTEKEGIMRVHERVLEAVVVCLLFFGVSGCDETTSILSPKDLNPPLGLSSVTGDGEVALAWYTSNFESDLDGYKVYVYVGAITNLSSRSSIPNGFAVADSTPVSGSSSGVQSIEVEGLVNGETYSFLVVAAKDDWTDLSHTSNIVVDTPRPEVINVELKDENLGQGDCCLRFSSSAPYVEVVGKTDPGAAIMFESFDAGLGKRSGLVGVQGRAQVQDLGYMANWDMADEAPTSGYPMSDFSVTAIPLHVYAVKTIGVNYAKIFVAGITGNPANNSDVATVWVAYQTDTNNPDYSRPFGE